jgi:hypothetical protein
MRLITATLATALLVFVLAFQCDDRESKSAKVKNDPPVTNATDLEPLSEDEISNICSAENAEKLECREALANKNYSPAAKVFCESLTDTPLTVPCFQGIAAKPLSQQQVNDCIGDYRPFEEIVDCLKAIPSPQAR